MAYSLDRFGLPHSRPSARYLSARCLSARCFMLLGSITVALSLGACGGVSGSDGTGGTGGNGEPATGGTGNGAAPMTGGSGAGSSTGGEATGGVGAENGTGGHGETGGNGGGSSESCTTDDDCVAVWPTSSPCYSPGCSQPTAALKDTADRDPCLIPWTETTSPEIPAGCAYPDDVICTTECAVPPECASAHCNEGQCIIDMGFSSEECATDGTDDCSTLESAFSTALAEARACLAGGTTASTECDAGDSIQDLCGCPQAVNSEATAAQAAAELARSAYEEQCEAPDECQSIDCAPAGESGTCKLTTHPSGVCVFEE